MENFDVNSFDFETMNNAIGTNPFENDKKDYFKDYRFGLVLCEYFHNTKGFSYRDLSDNGFWRFMSVKVIPDIVRDRWDGTEYKSPTHYGSKRIWLKT